MEEIISDEESFHNSYRVFHEAVEILSESAEKQCEVMGNYNVAWELKDDVSGGFYLLRDKASFLTPQQCYAIEQLIAELNKIPERVLISDTTVEGNYAVMQHPCWEPLRKHAVILIRSLESATQKNNEYFKRNSIKP